MKIQILGTGCAKCKKLFDNAAQAIKESGASCEIEKIEKIEEITKMNVFMTPALILNGEIKCSGGLLSVKEIRVMIEDAL